MRGFQMQAIWFGFMLYCANPIGAVPNPSAVFCEDMGYTYETRTNEVGNQYGVCIFPDGTSCLAWDFCRGLCGQQWHPCTLCGFDMPDPEDQVGYACGVCYDRETESLVPLVEMHSMIGRFPCRTSPEDFATDVPPDVTLSWSAMLGTEPRYDVYVGTRFEDVNEADRDDPRDVMIVQDLFAGNLEIGPLDFGQTYYWRVDILNESPAFAVKGTIRSFTVELLAYPIKDVDATASSVSGDDKGPEKTLDADVSSGWVTHSSDTAPWIQDEFTRPWKFHEMWVWNANLGTLGDLPGFGVKDVSIETSLDGSLWTALPGISSFARAIDEPDEIPDTVLDLGGVSARYVKLSIHSNWGGSTTAGLNEVRFMAIPTYARELKPEAGALTEGVTQVLSWRPGREAARHLVVVDTDRKKVEDSISVIGEVDSARRDDQSYEIWNLDLAETYYWRINEVNDAATPSLWEGDIWSFSTMDYLVVDDMESYQYMEWQEIWVYWHKGYNCNTAMSHGPDFDTVFIETEIVHSGKQSMGFELQGCNWLPTSEGQYVDPVQRTFSPSLDLTAGGGNTLSLWFYGDPNNIVKELYLDITDSSGQSTKFLYSGSAKDLTAGKWIEWNISFVDLKLNLRSIKSIGIGNDASAQGWMS